MAILNIIKDGDPTLRKTSREVKEITPRILTLLDDMTETLHEANGADLPRFRSAYSAASFSSRPTKRDFSNS